MAELESPQLVAARFAAQAALAVARADLDRINSTRPETIAARQADLDAAKADVDAQSRRPIKGRSNWPAPATRRRRGSMR